MDDIELLTVDETAAYLKISKGTVWTWCRNGQLPAIKIGRQWRIIRADLEKMIRPGPQGSHAVQASAEAEHLLR